MIGRLLSKLRREQPQDAFSSDGDDDDFYDEESERPNIGRRIALGISGLLFVGLIGLGAFVYMAGKDAPKPEPVMASLADLTVEEEEAPAITPAATSDAPAAPVAPGANVDTTAATDRSNERRPWLNTPPATGTPATPAPTAPAATPTTVAKATGVITPPAPATPLPPVTKPPAPPPVTKAPIAPPVGTPSPPAPAAVAEAHDPATPAPTSLDSILAKPGQADAAKPVEIQTTEAAAMPVDVAPGAPERYVGQAELMSGGRPVLADPPLPPVEKDMLRAPPPRFGNIVAIKASAASVAADKSGKTGKVAVIIQGLGLNEAATEAAITKFPKTVTLSFSPYARDIRKWLAAAKENGNEVLVEVPMESKLFPAEDPGPLGLMTELEPKENDERLKAILRTFPGVIGIDDIMGSKFRESDAPMRAVYDALKEAKLMYVQGRPGVQIGAPGVPNVIAHVVIDERPFRAAIDARLDYTERLAKFQGTAVSVMSAKPVSYERLALWLQQLDKRGIQLVPVSQALVENSPPI